MHTFLRGQGFCFFDCVYIQYLWWLVTETKPSTSALKYNVLLHLGNSLPRNSAAVSVQYQSTVWILPYYLEWGCSLRLILLLPTGGVSYVDIPMVLVLCGWVTKLQNSEREIKLWSGCLNTSGTNLHSMTSLPHLQIASDTPGLLRFRAI